MVRYGNYRVRSVDQLTAFQLDVSDWAIPRLTTETVWVYVLGHYCAKSWSSSSFLAEAHKV